MVVAGHPFDANHGLRPRSCAQRHLQEMLNSRPARRRPLALVEARSATRSDNESTQPWIEESGAELVAVQERVVDRQALQQFKSQQRLSSSSTL
jgi:hypothetical protein